VVSSDKGNEVAHSVGSPGGSNWMMTDTPEKSRPLAATSVHSSTPEALRENSRKVLVRSACTHRVINVQSQYAGAKNGIPPPPVFPPLSPKWPKDQGELQEHFKLLYIDGSLSSFSLFHEQTNKVGLRESSATMGYRAHQTMNLCHLLKAAM